MGRKIPGKKHRGVKNPLEQQKIRTESIKNKINSPPLDIDNQPMPESVRRLAQWTNLGCKDLKKKKTETKNAYRSWLSGEPKNNQPKKSLSQKARPSVGRRPGENESEFIDRLYKETNMERKQELKWLCREPNEAVQASKKVKGNVELIISNAGGNMKDTSTDEEYVSKKERKKRLLAAKKQEKMEKMQELQDERDLFKDHVEFGDIVHAPPVLSLPLRNKIKIEDAKLGHRKLMLDKMLETTFYSQGAELRLLKSKKLKHLGAKEREFRESARLQVVESYRRLKKQNQHQQ